MSIRFCSLLTEIRTGVWLYKKVLVKNQTGETELQTRADPVRGGGGGDMVMRDAKVSAVNRAAVRYGIRIIP